MESSPKQKFDAAVNVIQSLPKNGSFQPSHEMMLKFYAFYKQATEGQCTLSKPGFWDVVKKAKWEAWSKLEDMPREEAMISYVEELKQIIETMPQTQMVAEFVNKLGSFYEIVEDKSPIEIGYSGSKKKGGSTGSSPRESYPSSEHSDEKSDGFSETSIDVLLKRTIDGEEDTPDAIPDYSKYNPDRLPVNRDIQPKLQETEDDREADVKRTSHKKSVDSDDTDDEFCDSSEQPTEQTKSSKITPSVSTPLKHHDSGVIPFQRSQGKYMNMSPISSSKPLLPFLNNGPFHEFPRQQEAISDSLIVNCSTDSEDQTHTDSYSMKQPNGRIPMSSDLKDSFVEKTVDLQGGSMKARGGGSDFPPKSDSGLPVSGRTNAGYVERDGSRQKSSHGARQFTNPRKQAGGGGGNGNGEETMFSAGSGNINERIVVTLQKLEQDMHNVLQRVSELEQKYKKDGLWWHFSSTKGKLFFIVVWPLLVHVFLTFLSKRRKHSMR